MVFVYLLRCVDGSFYVGHANDLATREKVHNDGHGATYTAQRRPVEMIYAEEHASLQGAVARERQLKRWTAVKKLALAAGDNPRLKTLSRHHEQRAPNAIVTWRDLLIRNR